MTMTESSPDAVPSPIRVALVDDQQLVRAGFEMLVNSQPDMHVVAQAGDGLAALELIGQVDVDVVLLDVRMPRLDGVETTRRLLSAGARWPRVIVLTTFDVDEYAFAALQAGASAFLLKDAPPADLLAAIRSVHAGDAVVAPSTTRRLLDHFVAAARPDHDIGAGKTPADPAAARRIATLTAREREVLVLIGRGLSNPEIVDALVVSEATVKTHVSRLLSKTDSRDRVQLVLLALQNRLV